MILTLEQTLTSEEALQLKPGNIVLYQPSLYLYKGEHLNLIHDLTRKSISILNEAWEKRLGLPGEFISHSSYFLELALEGSEGALERWKKAHKINDPFIRLTISKVKNDFFLYQCQVESHNVSYIGIFVEEVPISELDFPNGFHHSIFYKNRE